MTLTVMLIVLSAAFLHAFWNFFVKRRSDKHISMGAVVIGHAPFALIVLLFSPLPSLSSVPYIIAGAALHSGYQIFLLYSYRTGDLSQVYPIARGISPLIVAFFSVFFLGTNLSRVEIIAVIIIGTGIMSLASGGKKSGLRGGHSVLPAIVTGCFIASYSLVDGTGARLAGTSTGFYGALSILNALIFSIFLIVIKPGAVSNVLFKKFRFALFGGGTSFLAYALVTWSFTVAPIPLVTALRETSIIFALLLGVFVLKEPFNLLKMAATFFTLLGVGLLRFNR